MLWSGIGATLTWQLRHSGSAKKISFWRRIGQALAAGVLLGITYISFLGGWWIPVVPPFIALASSSIIITAYTEASSGWQK